MNAASPKATSSSASPKATIPLDQSSSPTADALPAYARASNKSSLAGSHTNKSRTSKEVWIPDQFRRRQIERDLSLLRDRPGTTGGSTSRSPATASVSNSASASASAPSPSGPVSPKELKELKRVFDRLCQYSSNTKKQSQSHSQSPSSCKSSSRNQHIRYIRVQDIAAALRDLGKKATKQEVLDMLWEADEKNDGVIDWDELQLMFQRCVRDASGREPASLYYVVQFMIFDQDADGLVGIDDTMSILYARMGAEMMEQIINELFYDSNSCSDDGASSSNQGRGHSGKLDFVSFHKAWSKVLLGDRAE